MFKICKTYFNTSISCRQYRVVIARRGCAFDVTQEFTGICQGFLPSPFDRREFCCLQVSSSTLGGAAKTFTRFSDWLRQENGFPS